MPKQRKKYRPGKLYQVGQYITAEKLRVVDEAGKQIGVLTKEEALKLALEKNMTLVEVNPKAEPPVAKIIDFAKFKYQLQQKRSGGEVKGKRQDIKEIRFTPFIAENDYNRRIKRAQEFFEQGDKVKLVVKFVGRQITYKDFGKRIMDKAISDLTDYATVEREPSLLGKLLMAVLHPLKQSTPKTDDNHETLQS